MAFKIAPSILAADFGNLEAELAQLDPQLVDYIHVDVMDGRFVPNISFGPVVVKALQSRCSIPLDVHLMIEEPERYIKEFAEAGASVITVHQEACRHLQRTLQQIRELGAKAGVSLNPATPLDTLNHVLDDLDLILLMTVNPGFGGQKFIPQMMQKISECAAKIDGRQIELEVDGGVNSKNIKDLYQAGARVFVAGTAIFKHPPYNETIATMRSQIQ